MMSYSQDNYKITINGRTVIAEIEFNGAIVIGIAKAHTDDKWDEQKGIDLAIARCKRKIAKKKMKCAKKQIAEAEQKLAAARNHYKAVLRYINYVDNFDFESSQQLHSAIQKTKYTNI